MFWIEQVDKRRQRNKTWQDSENPRKFSLDATLAALHYESDIDSGVFDMPIDATPMRIDNPNFDGWRVTESGWHYALGKDLANHGDQDGWVGFGGRQGQHWFKFRLARVGYLHWPTRAWDDIGGAPNYKRQNLSQQTNEIEFSTDGSTQPIGSVATWADIWKTPVGGSLSVSWAVSGDRLKEEITINQAGREWIATNRPPSTPLNETYFGFVFQLDWSDIPKIYRQGILQNIEEDFADDDEPIELKDALDRLLAFMPISDVCVPVDPESEEVEIRQPLRKRFYKDTDGNYYLLLGIRADILNAMPVGDLIFDPSIDKDVTASSDDAYQDTGVVTIDDGWKVNDNFDEHFGFRWLDITIPDGSTIDAATNDLCVYGTAYDEPDHFIWFEDNGSPSTFTTGASNISGRTPTAAFTKLVSVDLGATDGAWLSTLITLPELKTIVQELIDSYSYAGGSAMVCIYQGSADTSRDFGIYFYDWSDQSRAPKIHIEYTAVAAGQPTQIRTQGVPTGSGSRDRPGKWN